jgi:hypothetical protein
MFTRRPGKKRQAAQGIDRKRSLQGIPVVSDDVTVKETGEGVLVLTIRVKRGKGLFQRFLPETIERSMKLDELGTFVFREIDGKRTVKQIVDRFVDRYRVNRREAELSCVSFIRSLAQRRVVALAIK